jgi:hypothetical protein
VASGGKISTAQMDWDDQHGGHTSAAPIEAEVEIAQDPGPVVLPIVVQSGETLHRRYTVEYRPNGVEVVTDIEEWVTKDE